MSYILNVMDMIAPQTEFILGGSDYGNTDTVDIPKEVKARLVPAVKHPKTGKIYLGRRGDSHKDVMTRHKLGWRALGLSFNSIEHTGYYDHATKRYYSHREAGFHSTDLLTPLQRFKKYGSESQA
jgi:hypothetical protein